MPSRISHVYITLILLLTMFISGQSVEATFSIKGGGATYFGEIHENKMTPYSALSMDLWLHRTVAFEVAAFYGQLKAEKNNEYFETELEGAAVMLKLRPFQKAVFSPYLVGGGEYFRFNPTNKLGFPLPNNAAGVYKKDRVGVPVGGGFSIFVTQGISIDRE